MFGCGIPILMTLLIFLVDYFQVGSLLPAVGIFRCFLSTQGLNLIQTWKQDRVWKFVGLTLILVLKNTVLKNIGISKLKRSLEKYKFFLWLSLFYEASRTLPFLFQPNLIYTSLSPCREVEKIVFN